MADQKVYQFYAELDDFKPKIWRRFQIRDDATVARLGYVLMTLFEMTGGHLFSIEIPWVHNRLKYKERTMPGCDNSEFTSIETKPVWRFEVPFQLEMEPLWNEETTAIYDASAGTLRQFIANEGDELRFNYDFGDDWNVSLHIEHALVLPDFPGRELPRVLDGGCFGIVEDCGGPYGLADLVKAFRKKRGEDYETFSEWMGVSDFDINAFDLDDMNYRVKKLPRVYQQSYEQFLSPTKKSIDLIERRYLEK